MPEVLHETPLARRAKRMTGDTRSDGGPQPLDRILNELGLSNADLVRASKEQLSFKVVQKARKGRKLTPNLQGKVLRALLAAHPAGGWTVRQIFNAQ
jgi:hypothetical protein